MLDLEEYTFTWVKLIFRSTLEKKKTGFALNMLLKPTKFEIFGVNSKFNSTNRIGGVIVVKTMQGFLTDAGFFSMFGP